MIKCEACRAFYLFVRSEFDKINNTGARMLYSICHMTLELFCNRIFGVKNVNILPSFTQLYNGRH